MRIYKYPLPDQKGFAIEMPIGARILSVQTQHTPSPFDGPLGPGTVMLWALVDPNSGRERRKFFFVPTGVEFPDAYLGPFITTCQRGPYVYHLFEAAEGLEGVIA